MIRYDVHKRPFSYNYNFIIYKYIPLRNRSIFFTVDFLNLIRCN